MCGKEKISFLFLFLISEEFMRFYLSFPIGFPLLWFFLLLSFLKAIHWPIEIRDQFETNMSRVRIKNACYRIFILLPSWACLDGGLLTLSWYISLRALFRVVAFAILFATRRRNSQTDATSCTTCIYNF